MSDKITLTLDLTPEKNQQIQEQTRRRGYDDPEDYLLALVDWDAEEEDDFDEDPKAAFRQAWHEAMTGETYPASTLWDDLDDD
jgi:hypothetical protein